VNVRTQKALITERGGGGGYTRLSLPTPVPRPSPRKTYPGRWIYLQLAACISIFYQPPEKTPPHPGGGRGGGHLECVWDLPRRFQAVFAGTHPVPLLHISDLLLQAHGREKGLLNLGHKAGHPLVELGAYEVCQKSWRMDVESVYRLRIDICKTRITIGWKASAWEALAESLMYAQLRCMTTYLDLFH